MKIKVLINLFTFFAITGTYAQHAPEVLQRAIDKQGNWASVSNLSLRTNRLNADQWQGYDYDHLVLQKDIFEIKFDLSAGNFENHTVNHYPGGYVFDTNRLGLDSVYWVYDGARSRTGNALLDLGKDLYRSKSKSLLSGSLPYYLLKDASNLKDLVLDTTQSWLVLKSSGREYWLNRSNLLLEKYVIVNNGASSVQTFEDYQTQYELAVPQLTSLSVNRQLVYRDTLKDFRINAGSVASGLKLPAKYVRTKEYDGALLVRKLAGHTFIIEKIDGDRNVIFRDMGDHIVLTEAPVSPGAVKEIIAKIASVFPDKPIKYVHLSHFHKDHIAGITELVALGATIICTPETGKPVMDLISQTFSGTDKKYIPKFLYIKKTLQLGRAGNCVQFYAIDNTHAKGMSFAYLPTEKIIYQGDLLSLPEDHTTTAAIPVNINFFKMLRSQKLNYQLVVGHHGLPEITAFRIHQMEANAKNHL
ncbi:hypothetical protein [Mucilaginibacter sp. HD30]